MKNIGLKINIGANVGNLVSKIGSVKKTIGGLGVNIEKLNSKRIELIANDENVLKAKKSIEDIGVRLDHLKKKKTELSLQLDKAKVTELNNQINKIDDKIDKLRDKEEIIKLKIEATTDEKELKKLNKSLDTTRKNILKLSSEKLEIKEELSDVKKANEKVNKELKKTSDEISELNSKKITLKEELKEAENQAEKTNKKVLNITKSIKRINAAKINIKSTIHKTEIIKQKFIGNVGKVTAMGVALGGVALGIKHINDETTQMANLAETVGLSFGTVNTLGTAVKGIGLNYEHVTDIMEELNNKIGESKVKYKEWLKEDKGKGKELKLVGGVDDAFKGLDFSLSDKSFKGLNYEETFKKFTKLKGDKQFELVIDTALKMKDEQKAASMVDILMGGEANKILSFLRKQGKTYKEFMEDQKKLNFLNDEGLKGAKEYSKVSAKTSSILGSIFQQISGIGGSFMTPILKDFNSWLVVNKEIVQSNIKGFFTGVKEAIGSIGTAINKVSNFIKPLISLFSSTSEEAEKAGQSGINLGKTLTYVAGGFTALIGAKLIMGGLGMAIGVVTTAFRALSVVASMNPIGLAVTAIAGGAYLIYRNWEGISSWFSAKWQSVKAIFTSAWSGIKTVLSWSPIGLIANNWQSILNFFSGIGTGVKNFLGSAWNGLKSIISWNPLTFISGKWQGVLNFFNNFSLFNAGKKIISSVVDGLSATWGKLTKKVGDITKSIRDFFPFSPAKRGALTDIHRIKLMETVAQGINDKPLLSAVNNSTKKVRKVLAVGGVGMAIGGSLAVAQPMFPTEMSETYKTKEILDSATINPISNREFLTKEKLLTSKLPTLKDRSFNTVENLKLSPINSIADRTFKTKEILDTATINPISNREFITREKLLTSKLPTLKDRSFNTVENLKLSSINSIPNRTFKTKEILDSATINPLSNREFITRENLDNATIQSNSLKSNTDTNTHKYINNSQISVSIGEINIQTIDGKVAEPQLLKEEIQQLIEDGIRQAQENTQDRQFYDIGGLG